MKMMQKAGSENFSWAIFLSVFLGHSKTHIELPSDIAIKNKQKNEKSFVICFWRCPTKRTTDGEKKKSKQKKKERQRKQYWAHFLIFFLLKKNHRWRKKK